MLPTNVEDRKRILHFASYEPTFRTSPYYEEALAVVRKVCIEYNFSLAPDEFVHFSAVCFPLLPRDDFLTTSTFLPFCWESDQVHDDSRHKMSIRVHQLDSLYSAITTGKVEPYTHSADYLLYGLNQIKSEYIRNVVREKYLLCLDLQRRILNKSKTIMSVEDIIEHRKIDTCTDMIYSFLFLDVENPRQHEEFLKSELGNRIFELASENVVIINDIASLKNDKTTGSYLNTVISWMKEYDVSEEEAIDTLSLRAKELYLELVKIEKVTQDPVGLDVLKRILHFTSGQVFWSAVTPRYRK